MYTTVLINKIIFKVKCWRAVCRGAFYLRSSQLLITVYIHKEASVKDFNYCLMIVFTSFKDKMCLIDMWGLIWSTQEHSSLLAVQNSDTQSTIREKNVTFNEVLFFILFSLNEDLIIKMLQTNFVLLINQSVWCFVFLSTDCVFGFLTWLHVSQPGGAEELCMSDEEQDQKKTSSPSAVYKSPVCAVV